jgi:hypothetical protein
MTDTIRLKVLNGSAVIENNGEEQHVTTGEFIYVQIPDGWHLVPPLELKEKGVPSREWLG